jgi:indolepyruvate ferredoxin oxidoreductase
MDAVQRELRDIKGVTLLIYDQTCAAEKRRRRKKKELVDPPQRIFINERVCEGCGDCGVASNCLSVIPVETDWGRKRQIEQSSCNKDFSCVNGFCPSFVTVEGAVLKKRVGSGISADAVARELAAVAPPAPWPWTGPFDLLVTGVGGTGVVTVGALITMAAHLEHKQASVLDFMGFAQKGGAVLSFVRLALTPDQLNQVRIDTQQADLVLACDMVVGASADALGTVKHGRTVVIANTHELATAAFVRDPNASLHADALLAKLRHAAGDERVFTTDAQAVAQRMLGDTMPANIVMLGVAFQRGLVPVSEAALMRAVELNGVAVQTNKLAFALGRLAVAVPEALLRLEGSPTSPATDTLDALIARREAFLTDYQDAALAQRFRAFVDRVRRAEAPLGREALTDAVARQYARLLAVKDEYEVARLYTDGGFMQSLGEQFERWDGLAFHMAPPLLTRRGADGRPHKMRLGAWLMPALRMLAKVRRIRGRWFDPFGHTEERKLERQLARDYEALIGEVLASLTADKHALAVSIAKVPENIRGYGHVKLASVASAKGRWRELQDRFHDKTMAASRTIPIVTAESMFSP